MKQRARLTTLQKVDIIKTYSIDLEPMISIATRYGITRQGVHKILHKAGIATDKANTGHLNVSCSACGKEFSQHRYRVRKQLHCFCSSDCYYAFLAAGNGLPYLPNRYGGIVARTIVEQHFALQEKHVVHHEDRNQLNNHLDNLRVFANQGDHVRHHRGFDVEVIWDGRLVL